MATNDPRLYQDSNGDYYIIGKRETSRTNQEVITQLYSGQTAIKLSDEMCVQFGLKTSGIARTIGYSRIIKTGLPLEPRVMPDLDDTVTRSMPPIEIPQYEKPIRPKPDVDFQV